MKKILALVMMLAIMLVQVPTAKCATVMDKLVVLGDSIAFGYGIEKPEDVYGYIVAKERDYELINDAVSGDTTSDLLAILEKNNKVKDDVKSAETVVISIGGNDFLHLGYESSFSELSEIISKGKDSKIIKNMVKTVESNIRSIHQCITELNPNCKIILQTVYNPFLGQTDTFTVLLMQLTELVRQDYIDIYKAEAKTDSNMVIADVEEKFRTYYNQTKNTSLVQNDYIHPSVKGHKLIAQMVEKSLDDVHKASWSSLKKSADCMIRLAERVIAE
ncbi:MAG: hypothetical protein J1F17_05495 [Oscillospiraceae bacterium]|nr:hypothetical protein [Oscillospiraceae bacterium]